MLGEARDAEVLAERYRNALDGLPPELVRGPVRERLVTVPSTVIGPGCGIVGRLRSHGISVCSTRWMHWSPRPAADAGAAPAVTVAAAGKRVRKAAKAADRPPTKRLATRRPEATPNPQARQAASLHRGRDRCEEGVQAGERNPVAARRPPGQRGQSGPLSSRPTPRTPRAKTPSPTACFTARRPSGRRQPPAARAARCASSAKRCASGRAELAGRASWRVSRILFRASW